MGLDIKTLFVADVAVLLVTACVSFYFWHRDRDGDWLLWWALGTAMTGIAMLVIGVSGPVPGPVFGLSAATIFFAGLMMVWQSMRRLNGRPAVMGTVIALVLAFVVALSAAIILGADLRERSALLMTAMALSAMACAWEVTFRAPTPSRTRFPLAAILFVMGVLLALSAVLTELREHAPVASFGDLLGDTLPLINSFGNASAGRQNRWFWHNASQRRQRSDGQSHHSIGAGDRRRRRQPRRGGDRRERCVRQPVEHGIGGWSDVWRF